MSALLPEDLKPLTVTVHTAKKISGLGNTTLWGKIKDETLEVVRVGSRTLIVYRSLEKMLSKPCSGSERLPPRRGRPRKVAVGAKP